MSLSYRFIAALYLLSSLSVNAMAMEAMSARELASLCQSLNRVPAGVDAQYCIRYIQGFIDGAAATDVSVMLEEQRSTSTGETFTERAMRTRALSRTESNRAAQLAGFCIGEQAALATIVSTVAADLQELNPATTEDTNARDAVYRSLKQHYPCDS
ncbi:MAG: Rap1a/Tai family immunity protein [Pseudomonadota bacterium]